MANLGLHLMYMKTIHLMQCSMGQFTLLCWRSLVNPLCLPCIAGAPSVTTADSLSALNISLPLVVS